jgi:hypothetical protein
VGGATPGPLHRQAIVLPPCQRDRQSPPFHPYDDLHLDHDGGDPRLHLGGIPPCSPNSRPEGIGQERELTRQPRGPMSVEDREARKSGGLSRSTRQAPSVLYCTPRPHPIQWCPSDSWVHVRDHVQVREHDDLDPPVQAPSFRRLVHRHGMILPISGAREILR